MTENDLIRAKILTDTLFATRYLFRKRFSRKFIVGNHHKLIAEHFRPCFLMAKLSPG